MLDVQAILNDPKYQREVQRRIAHSRATAVANMGGTWKEKAVNAAFLSASSEQAKRQYNDLLVGARKLRDENALKRSSDQFNASMSLRRDAAGQDVKDSRIADVVSGAGAVVGGYTGYQNMKSQQDLANELRRMGQTYRGAV